MSDYTTLVQIGLAVAATITPVVVLVRILAGGPPIELDDRRHSRHAWPFGVQEEEPLPWRFAPSAP